MVTTCDRCGDIAFHNVGYWVEEDLCDKHYKEWLKKNKCRKDEEKAQK